MRREAPKGFCRERRKVLRLFGEAAGGLTGAAMALSIGCSREGVEAATVPLADLPLGVRVRVLDGEHPVELLRTQAGVEARSLWCTHTGCEVRWYADREEYVCPCHDAVFDADGKVMAGPPPRPLVGYPIRVTQTEVVLGDSTAG